MRWAVPWWLGALIWFWRLSPLTRWIMRKVLLRVMERRQAGLTRLVSGITYPILVDNGVSVAMLGAAVRDIALKLSGAPLPTGLTPARIDVAEGGAEVTEEILLYYQLILEGQLSAAQQSENAALKARIGTLLEQVAARLDALAVSVTAPAA